ncbi:hypothetical protein F2P81_020920 [Scophthalmus maximus]|uniref:Uncharacterized protein n=1 Tax=Scophthalmus maximus TaxID=52904 RepID=A0A6A4RVW5_SCOMX|nr:hypothetical protein F2P81_020920 [Scophthalmus maximus]
MVGGQQTSFGPGLHDESSRRPILQRTGSFDGVCIIHTLWWYENVVESVQKDSTKTDAPKTSVRSSASCAYALLSFVGSIKEKGKLILDGWSTSFKQG